MIIDQPENRFFKKKKTINYNGHLVSLADPIVMGILNITPDSFYDGGKFVDLENAVDQGVRLYQQGARIIDVGACSTRPGAQPPDTQTEIKRLVPVIKRLKKELPDAIVSIDTYRSEVARNIVDLCGTCIVNDISGGTIDSDMFNIVAELGVPYIVMHIQGTPGTMQKNPTYNNVTKEVIKHLSEKVNKLHQLGVSDVIIDPGFGFGKTLDQNYELINHLDAFRFFELPLLVGISRKSMIYKFLDISPDKSLNGTTVLNTMSLLAGADILRVHDVPEAVECVRMFNKIKTFAK